MYFRNNGYSSNFAIVIRNNMKSHSFIYLIIYSCFIMSMSLQAQEHFADRYNVSYITMDDGYLIIPLTTFIKTPMVFYGYPLPEADCHVMMAMNSFISIPILLTANSRVTLSTMYMKTDSTVFGLYPKEAQILSTYLLYNL